MSNYVPADDREASLLKWKPLNETRPYVDLALSAHTAPAWSLFAASSEADELLRVTPYPEALPLSETILEKMFGYPFNDEESLCLRTGGTPWTARQIAGQVPNGLRHRRPEEDNFYRPLVKNITPTDPSSNGLPVSVQLTPDWSLAYKARLSVQLSDGTGLPPSTKYSSALRPLSVDDGTMARGSFPTQHPTTHQSVFVEALKQVNCVPVYAESLEAHFQLLRQEWQPVLAKDKSESEFIEIVDCWKSVQTPTGYQWVPEKVTLKLGVSLARWGGPHDERSEVPALKVT